jgi:hypothetical protein
MTCSECGQDIKEGTIIKNTRSLTLPIISIIVSSIGIVGYWIFNALTKNLGKSLSEGNYLEEDLQTLVNKYQSYIVTQVCFSLLLTIGIIILLIAQYKKKSLFGLIIGLILCIYIIVLPLIQILIIQMQILR